MTADRSVVIAATADVDPSTSVGPGSRIWHLAQIREGARLGADCNVGRGAYVGPGVVIGDNCKLQNYALVYEPARLGDGVFIGPAAVLTNDEFPRAANLDGSVKSGGDWQAVGVIVDDGASIGARAVCVAPVTIGAWALVAAGAVVTKDVPAHALMVGVPARRIGWVGRAGRPLVQDGDGWRCPVTDERYREEGDGLRLVGWPRA
jgi:UDP-2-acetamido-3-amino-2,3-dideoxy-glucuronate N-acetyltransferase